MAKPGPKRELRRADVFSALLTDPYEPRTAPEIADEMGYDKERVYDRLRELHEAGMVATKKVGARARVWWVPNRTERPYDVPAAEGAYGADGRQYVEPADVFAALAQPDDLHEPMTAPEIADVLGCDRSPVYDRLRGELHDAGVVESKHAGARARVWWVPPGAHAPLAAVPDARTAPADD